MYTLCSTPMTALDIVKILLQIFKKMLNYVNLKLMFELVYFIFNVAKIEQKYKPIHIMKQFYNIQLAKITKYEIIMSQYLVTMTQRVQ